MLAYTYNGLIPAARLFLNCPIWQSLVVVVMVVLVDGMTKRGPVRQPSVQTLRMQKGGPRGLRASKKSTERAPSQLSCPSICPFST